MGKELKARNGEGMREKERERQVKRGKSWKERKGECRRRQKTARENRQEKT